MATKPLIILARHKFLLAIPFLVIIPAAVMLSLLNRTNVYESKSTVWVQPPTFIQQYQQQGSNYLTPAQNQANTLNEKLATDAFANVVAQSVHIPSGKQMTADSVRQGTTIIGSGTYSLIVRHEAREAGEAQAVVAAIVEQYKAEYAADLAQQATLAKDYYTSQLTSQQKTLDDARAAVASYARAHPSVTTPEGSVTDPAFLSLNAAATQANDLFQSTTALLNQATTVSGATQVGLPSSIDVKDAANLPSAPMHISAKKLLALPAAGLLLAVSLTAGIYAFLLRTDNSIRVAEDLQALPGLLLLGTVPEASAVRRRGWPKHYFRLAVTALGVSSPR